MIKAHIFGQLPNGNNVTAYDITSDSGLKAVVLSCGATLQSLRLPSGLDVVLGFDDLDGYLGYHPYFGAVIGRVANRIGGAAIDVDGMQHKLFANEGVNTLHGGAEGFDRANWIGEIKSEVLTLRHTSPDGDQGFPGRVETELEFSIKETTLSIVMRATTDKATPINLTHHSYFNLTDGGESPCHDHALEVLSDDYTPMDDVNLPTGEIKSVSETDHDFRTAKALSADIPLDHNFIRRHQESISVVKKVAKLRSVSTGNTLIICSTQPCLQVYTGKCIPVLAGKSNAKYDAYHGVALEPQGFVDSLNHALFPSQLLRPDEEYSQTIRYTFKTELGLV